MQMVGVIPAARSTALASVSFTSTWSDVSTAPFLGCTTNTGRPSSASSGLLPSEDGTDDALVAATHATSAASTTVTGHDTMPAFM